MAGYLDLIRGSLRSPESEREMQSAAPARGEVALWDSELYPRGTRTFPWNPDLLQRRKGGLRIYDQMKRDAVINSCQELKKLAVLCSGWAIVPASKDNDDQEPADFVDEVFDELPGTLGAIIRRILSGSDYGFSVSEKIWQPIPEGDFKGKWGIKDIKTRKPHRFDFSTDEFGNLLPQGLWQDNGRYKYDPAKFIIYSHNMEWSNWYGESDLHKIYPHWWSKDNLIKFWNIFLERFGTGIPWLHPAEGKQTIPEPTFTSLKNAIMSIQNTSAIAQQTADAQIDVIESRRRAAGEYDSAIAYHDRAISRGLLIPVGLGFSEDKTSGSLARSKKHFDMWVMVIEDLRGTIEEVLQEQVVRPLVDYNYTVKKYPKFKFEALSQDETSALAELWLKAITGKAVHPTAEDENRFRVMIDFPERDEDELAEEFDRDRKIAETEKVAPPALPGPQAPPIEVKQIAKALPAPAVAKEKGPAAKEQPNVEEIEAQEKTAGHELPSDSPDEEEAERKHEAVVILASDIYAFASERDLSKFERRVDYAEIERSLNDLEAEALQRLTEILDDQRAKVLTRIKKKYNSGAATDMTWINSFALPYGVLFTATLRDFIRSAFDLGRDDADTEVARAQAEKKFALRRKRLFPKLPPLSQIKALQDLAFWIKSVLFDGLTKTIQKFLISAMETGEGTGETLMKVRKAYDPYIGDEQVVADQRQIEPYRIETLIRTNSTRAYNHGRVAEFRNPKLEGFVRAVQLSAILDERTTDICREADHVIILLDDPMLDRLKPPLHYNCRTVMIAVTAADGQFEPTPQAELAKILSLMPEEFGGNIDKGHEGTKTKEMGGEKSE